MQISPPKHLASYIKHYIFLDNSEEDIKKLRLFTDGNTGLILSANINLQNLSGNQLPLSFFYGQLTLYKDLIANGSFSLIAVVFQPYFLNILLKISAKEVQNQIISVEDVLKNEMQIFQEKLFYKTDPKLIINDLNIYFTQFLSKIINSDYELIKATQQYIIENKGIITSKNLEHFTGYSERQIERKFQNYIGLSPKKYSNIARLHYFLSLMKINNNEENITGLSYKAGYADQSHLIKEFKNNIGLTPSEYLKTENKLAVNFIELLSQ
ncbi:helix-turn-helix domain-containing protein [Chryseobacterium sp. G0201]|uniref:helix-turn-helix domain-containing protein n=1 Tax=Chryseobacterium sp. G0201 TaxID=2487065 RepID=UPI000F4E47C2|nr:helix-turn-helix domain-containing protein [Chryseobacterium sp. G0201]AZA54908.1 AraC family transcriptional regulator [Chryseobacterium sp. G0201]